MKRKTHAVLAAFAVSVAALARCNACGERPLRVGTYNIEQFGNAQKKTDMDRLVAIVAGVDPDVLAIQEIQNAARAKDLAERLSHGPRSYAVGDTNSTGWLDGRFDERKFIETEAESEGKVVATRDLACSEYWQPPSESDEPSGRLSVSLLDHVVAPPGFVKKRSVTVHSFCRELRCKTTDKKPDDFERVSDHCPVTFEIEPRFQP